MAQHITTLPMRMGGLGLRSAMRTAPGAYWASWADALHMLQQRLPQFTGLVVHHLSHPNASGCLGELQESASRLDRDGFVSRPRWDMLRTPPDRGARRVASRLAVLFVFQFRTPVSGDGSACPVVCCRPRPLAITLRTMRQPGVAWVSHCGRVSRQAPPVPDVGS